MVKSNKSSVDDAVRQYIAEYGFGAKTSPLNKTLPADVFKQHYYDKKELMNFCRSIGIPTFGLKNELNIRIEQYLRTGNVTVVRPQKKYKTPDSDTGLSLDKVVANYKSDPATRLFFANHIPGFTGFSALVQKQIKQRLADGDTFTYSDAIEMHKTFLSNKKISKTTSVAHDSCQFNQFYIDYNRDESAKVHTAKEAWMLVRNSAGEKTYQRYKVKIEEIRSILKTQQKVNTI